jgi:hypothetical protein
MLEKKYTFLLSFLFALFLIPLGFSTSHNITSCGTYSFTQNDTYYINLSSTIITSGNQCLYVTASDVNNVTFVQLNPSIKISTPNNYNFLSVINHKITHSRFYNFTLTFSNTNYQNSFIRTNAGSASNVNIEYSNFSNLQVKNNTNFLEVENGFSTGSGSIKNNIFNNVTLIRNTNLFRTVVYNGLSSTNRLIGNLQINNSIFDIQTFYNDTGTSRSSITDNNTYYNSVIYSSQSNQFNLLKNSIFQNSLIEFHLFNDSDENNIADTNYYNSTYNYSLNSMKIYLTLNGYTYTQNYLFNQYNLHNKKVIFLNNMNLEGSTFSNTKNNLYDLLDTDNNMTLVNAIQLFSNSTLQCEFYNCNLNDYSTSTYTSNNAINFPLISTNGNDITIRNIIFNNYYNNNNVSMIGNYQNYLYDTISLHNNFFSISKSNDSLSNKGYINLYYNNINITNNTFALSGSSSVQHNIFDIKSSLSTTNNIYRNNFTSIITNTTYPSYIFNQYGQTQFYDNYISSNIKLSQNSLSNLNVNPSKSYVYNGYVYTFTLGNYYEDNVGCVDSNNDGFCDSSYTSGSITDNHPLSSYPFDYMAHLYTADSIVPYSNITVTLTEPNNNQLFKLNSNDDKITFGFKQDSTYSDVTCTYYINGIDVYTQNNVINGTIYTINVTGWQVHNNTYRVYCENSVAQANSNQINFYVTTPTISGSGGTGGGGTTTTNQTNYYNSSYKTPDLNVFGSNISETNNNIKSLFSSFGTVQGFLLYAGLIILMFACLGLVISFFVWLFS